MRVLHVDTGREMRGGQRQALLLMEGLRSAGLENVLQARPQSPIWNAAAAAGFATEPATLIGLWRRSRHADLVHAHDARAHTLAALAARCPFVVSRRVAFPVRRSIASRWKYGLAAYFLAVSRFVAAELESAGVPSDKIRIVYDCVEPVTSAVEAWQPEGPAVALATRDPQKGRDLIEEAVRISAIPVKFSDDLRRDLPGASMFVYVTRSEGLGSAVLLAMSMGVPVIASSTGGLREVVSDGISGLLVENEPRTIADAMRRLLGDAALAASLVENARSRIIECFTQERMVEETLAVYRSAVAR